jgi:hypothetical protein
MRNSHASEPATVRLRRASSGGVCRREFARSNLSRLGQRTQALHLLFLLTLRLRSPLAAAAFTLRGAKKRPQHGLRPSPAVLCRRQTLQAQRSDPTTAHVHPRHGLLDYPVRINPAGFPRLNLDREWSNSASTKKRPQRGERL